MPLLSFRARHARICGPSIWPHIGYYDGAIYGRFVEPLVSRTHALVAGGVEEGARVLDACCGTGALSFRLARRGHRVVGVDSSSAMVEYAEARRRREGIGHLQFREGDVSRLADIEDGAFDVAIVVFALHEMPAATRDQVLPELLRVAAKVLVVDYAVPMRWNLQGARNRLLEVLAGRRHFAGYRDFVRRGGLAPLVEAAGAQTVRRGLADNGNVAVLTLVPSRHGQSGRIQHISPQ